MSIKIRKETKVEPEIWDETKANESPDSTQKVYPDSCSSPINNKHKLKENDKILNNQEDEISIEMESK